MPETPTNPTPATNDRDRWFTPQALVDAVAARLGVDFTLDPAAEDGAAKAPVYFTAADDGLAQDWNAAANGGGIWMNPPYSDVTPWVEKAAATAAAGTPVVALLRASTDTRWWHDHCAGAAEVWALKGRVRFERPGGGSPGPANHASVVVVWLPDTDGSTVMRSVATADLLEEGAALAEAAALNTLEGRLDACPVSASNQTEDLVVEYGRDHRGRPMNVWWSRLGTDDGEPCATPVSVELFDEDARRLLPRVLRLDPRTMDVLEVDGNLLSSRADIAGLVGAVLDAVTAAAACEQGWAGDTGCVVCDAPVTDPDHDTWCTPCLSRMDVLCCETCGRPAGGTREVLHLNDGGVWCHSCVYRTSCKDVGCYGRDYDHRHP